MILLLSMLGIAGASFAALAQWRWSLFLIVTIAAFQDPIRKITPGTPGWMTMLSVPVFFAAVIASRGRMKHWWTRFARAYPDIGTRLALLMVLALPAALISLTYGAGSWKFTMLGVFAYSLIFLAIILGFHFGRNIDHVRKLIGFYVVVHGTMLAGGVIQYAGWGLDSSILGDAMLGFEWVRWIPGHTVHMISGFYRSSDVMGWHASSVCMLALALAFSAKGRARWFWLAVSAWAILALFLCGRRKMVYMVPIFLMVVIWIYFYVGRVARIIPLVGFLAIPAVSVYYVSDFLADDSANIIYYTSANEGDSAWDRFQVHGFGSLVTTYRQSGMFGMGLGFATPGAHHLRGARPYVWQESGTSRVLAELGVPGFIGFLAVLAAIVAALWRVTRAHLRARTSTGALAAGLLAFFVANLGSLTVSGQILADSFIVVFMGVLVGIVLGFARAEFMPAQLPVSQGAPG